MPYPVAAVRGKGGKVAAVVVPFPSDLTLAARYIADTGVFKDAAKTQPATADTDAVYTWADQSGNGLDWVQAGATQQPTLKLNIVNTHPVIRFDGSNDVMAATQAAGAAKTIFIVVKKRSAPGANKTIYKDNTGTCTLYTSTGVGVGFNFYQSNPPAPGEADLGGLPASWGLVCLKFVSTSSLISYMNGVPTYLTAPTDSFATATNLLLGAGNAAGAGANDVDIAEIIKFDSALSDANRIRVENYIFNHYGFTRGDGLIPLWNPTQTVLSASTVGEDGNVYEPTVLYEGGPQILTGATNVFKMWYTGGWDTGTICYAESLDGIAWTKYTSNPLLSGFYRSTVLHSGATYYMYLTVADAHIDLYTSADGLTWALDTANCIVKGGVGEFDHNNVANCFVWIEGAGDWRMLYDGGNGTRYQEGYATSADGKSWTKYASNPVITQANVTTGAPSQVVKVGSTYWVWMLKSISSLLPTDLYRFSSPDCITWTQNPLFSILPRLTTDEGVLTLVGQCADPYILEVGGKAYLYYAASANGTQKSGAQHIKLGIANMTLAQLVATDERVPFA